MQTNTNGGLSLNKMTTASVPSGQRQPGWQSVLPWHSMPCWKSAQRWGHWLAHITNSWPGGQPFSSGSTQTEGHKKKKFPRRYRAFSPHQHAQPSMLITGCAEILTIKMYLRKKPHAESISICPCTGWTSPRGHSNRNSKSVRRPSWVCLTTGFGVAGLDLVLLSDTLFSTVLGWRAGAGASAYWAPAATSLVTAGPGAPPGPASVHCIVQTHKQAWWQKHSESKPNWGNLWPVITGNLSLDKWCEQFN